MGSLISLAVVASAGRIRRIVPSFPLPTGGSWACIQKPARRPDGTFHGTEQGSRKPEQANADPEVEQTDPQPGLGH